MNRVSSEDPNCDPSVKFRQSRPGSTTLPLHDGEGSLGSSQGSLQVLSFLGCLLVMTQHLILFMKVTPGVITVV
jgi:hypothetical protein